MVEISRATVFWRKPEDQAVDNSGRPHHWVVLTDPAFVDGRQTVLWVPLSSRKAWMDYPPETYVFNVGKYNKHIDSRQDSTADVRFAEIVSVAAIEAEGPQRQHRIRERDVVGIAQQLMASFATPEEARRFYADFGEPLE